jgi:hypothetical protein
MYKGDMWWWAEACARPSALKRSRLCPVPCAVVSRCAPLSSTCQKYAPDRTRAHNGAPAVSTRIYGVKARPGAELCTPVPFPWTRSGFQSQTSVGVPLGFEADRTACGRGKRAVRLLQVAEAGLVHVVPGQTRSVHQPAPWE